MEEVDVVIIGAGISGIDAVSSSPARCCRGCSSLRLSAGADDAPHCRPALPVDIGRTLTVSCCAAQAHHMKVDCPQCSFVVLERRASHGGTWDLMK